MQKHVYIKCKNIYTIYTFSWIYFKLLKVKLAMRNSYGLIDYYTDCTSKIPLFKLFDKVHTEWFYTVLDVCKNSRERIPD